MNLRKGFSTLVMAMVFAVTASMPAFADAGTKTASFDTGRIHVSNEHMVMQRTNEAPTHVGEVKEAGQLDDGTILYVELTEQTSDELTRGTNKTSSKTFTFYTVNTAGKKVTAFTVKSTCSWYLDGENSYIKNLNCSYTISDNRFSCAWDKDNATNEPLDHSLPLEVSSTAGNAYYVFYASLNPYTTNIAPVLGYQS